MRIEIKDRRNNIREIWYAGERTENTKWVERLERNDKEVQKSNEQGIKIVKRFKILQNLRRRQLRNRFHQCLSDIQNQCLSDIPILYENSFNVSFDHTSLSKSFPKLNLNRIKGANIRLNTRTELEL